MSLVQEGPNFKGTLEDTADPSISLIEGTVEGRRVRFTRRWTNAGGVQHYEMTVSEGGKELTGSFTHWDGALGDFRMKRSP